MQASDGTRPGPIRATCGTTLRRGVLAALVAAGLWLTAGPARAGDALDLRHAEYTFLTDAAPVGPWSVYRATYTHTSDTDTINLEAVNGVRLDPGHPVHGSFYRLEDFHRFTRWLTTRLSLGSGNGYSPLRSTSGEVVVGPGTAPKYVFVLGANLTSSNNKSLQRVVAAGSEWRAGIYSGSVRYYQTSSTTPNSAGPSTLALGLAATPPHRLQYLLNFNAGGEMSGDRTAAILPTGSGRQGPDGTLTVRVPVDRAYLFAADEDSFYKDRAGLRRNQHVFTLGLSRSW